MFVFVCVSVYMYDAVHVYYVSMNLCDGVVASWNSFVLSCTILVAGSACVQWVSICCHARMHTCSMAWGLSLALCVYTIDIYVYVAVYVCL